MVTRGTNVFHEGQVEVSIRTSQTSWQGAAIDVALSICSTASEAEMLGVDLDASDAVDDGGVGVIVD